MNTKNSSNNPFDSLRPRVKKGIPALSKKPRDWGKTIVGALSRAKFDRYETAK
jgi:hypothetical protein